MNNGGMDYQIGEEVKYAGEKVIIKEVYGDGTLGIEVNKKLRKVPYHLVEGQKPIEVEFMGRTSYHQPGTISNSIIRQRNGGVRHQFEDSIGGCSSNYR